MRVALIAGPQVPVPPSKYGGTEQIISYLIKGLLEEGHTPILFGAGDSTVDCEVVPVVGKAIYFPQQKSELQEHYRKLKQINRRTNKLLRQHADKFDIVHSHGFDLREFQDVPNLTTLHSEVQLDDLRYYAARQNLYYVSISKNQQLSCPDLQYVGTVYNGLDPSQFPRVANADEYVCFLGRFDRQKNPHLAIQLAIALGIKIKVAGKFDFEGDGYFQQEIEPLLTHPLVEYLGEIDFRQKIKLLSNALCNLHPTGFREPFGLTVLEAAYCGTPTLAISRGSMPELIEDGRTGVLVEDFVEGHHRIAECFEMDRLYIASRARMLFNYQTMSQQYLKAYQKVIDIVDLKYDQKEAVRDLARGAKEQIADIWEQKRTHVKRQKT